MTKWYDKVPLPAPSKPVWPSKKDPGEEDWA